MSDFSLDFSHRTIYPSLQQGINVDIELSSGKDLAVAISAKIDSRSTLCIFQKQYGEMLELDIEKGEPEIIRTATGKFIAYGHEVVLTFGAMSWEATVYFPQDANFPVNVLGRIGFFDRLQIGIIDYRQELYFGAVK